MDPREGLGCLVDEYEPYGLLLSHVVGRRQASLGTPVPRTPTGGLVALLGKDLAEDRCLLILI